MRSLPLEKSVGLVRSVASDSVSSQPTSTYLARPLRSLDAAKTITNVKARLLAANERRSSDRHMANLTAKVIGLADFKALKCNVRDISETGVRLSFEEPAPALPKLLKLHIEDLNLIVSCELKWQTDYQSGLIFVFGASDG